MSEKSASLTSHCPVGAPKGRLDIIKDLRSREGPSVSIGSSMYQVADVNIDIDPTCEPDIIGDCLNLPLATGIFKEALFTDVIEHLPLGAEIRALREINRILAKNGRLVLSTPNKRRIFSLMDLSGWFGTHRHYSIGRIKQLLDQTGFVIDLAFTAGGVSTMLAVFRHGLYTYSLRRLKGKMTPNPPASFSLREEEDYRGRRPCGGYTLFVVASKV